MKLSKALLVSALALAISAPVFAETQNVKVSGSIDAYWFIRENYDMNRDGSDIAGGNSDASSFGRTNTQVEVSADLTDNVSTVINLINQRDWTGSTSVAGGDSTTDINLDLAYVQMKELFYSPLTLTVGRQDLWFGRGFVIGNNNKAWDVDGTTAADEYSVTTAFDAVRATLDFNPWTIDAVYSKISEGNTNADNDIDLWIFNGNYKFAEWNAVAEVYYVAEYNNVTTGADQSDTQTIGLRGQFDPISQATLGAEVAWQGGEQNSANISRDRNAWATDLFATYRWDNNQWKPSLTLEYVYFSGEEDNGANSNSDYSAWNGLYRGKFYTAYEDFRSFVYATDQAGDQPGVENSQMIQVKGTIKPNEDWLLEAAYSWFTTPAQLSNAGGALDTEIGQELDLVATYDYTEDVSFGILAGWFFPGDLFVAPNDETVTDIVTSVKVTF